MSRTNWYEVWRDKQMKYRTGYRYLGNRGKLWVRLAGLVLLTAVVGCVGILGLFIFFAKDLPSPDRVVRREGFSSRIYDRNGKVLYDVFSGQKRTPVNMDQVPKQLQDATVAIEDKNFYTHAGIDPLTPLRIAYNLVLKRRVVGGSSLTQQLVKNVLLTNERTLWRKIKEFILTLEVESKYSKVQILQMYLNEVPYGGTAYGVGAAADAYFGKKVADLSLPEAAILAGLPQSPSTYSPTVGTRYIDRAKEVLRRMREDGYITKSQEAEASNQLAQVVIATQSGLLKAPHFVFYVKQLLADKYGEKVVEEGGLRVTTTLDWDLQEKAQQIVTEEVAKVKHLNIGNGAAIVIDTKNGQILAMVGSKGWELPDYDGKFNVVTQGLRQPGSAIKPVVYVTALRKGYTASTMLMDVSTVFPGGDKPEYVPVDYDGKWRGPVLVREALGNSLNLPAVKMVSLVGIKDMLAMGYDLGFSSLEPTPELLRRVGLSIALGGGEVKLIDMATAYSAFANGGRRIEPTAILKVTDINGKVLEENSPEESGRQVLSAEEAYIISAILSDPEARKITFGTGSLLEIPGKTVAVKTGTTNDKKDNWTVGWTPGSIVGVWVGNNDNTSMKQVASGVTGASPIWRKIMLEVLKGKADEKFVRPEGIVEIDVDKVSGYRAHDGFEAKREIFIKGTEPWADDPTHKKVKVCKGEGKLATPADMASGNYEEKEFIYLKEEDPFESVTGKNNWQEGILNWLKDQADPKYHPPSEYCGNTNPLWVRITDPGDKSRINSRDVKVRVEVDDINPVRRIDVFLDGNLRYTNGSAPYEVTIPNVSDGYHKIDIRAEDDKGNVGSRYTEFAVNQDYVGPPSPTPVPSPASTP
jgi:1A family penicillin-binding protein